MTVLEFFLQKIRERLQQHHALVLHDPEQRWLQALQQWENPPRGFQLVAVANSTLRGREEVMQAWCELGNHRAGEMHLLIWLPWAKPLREEQKMHDPFAHLAACASVFPFDDSDTFASLCKGAKPERQVEIQRLFEKGSPSLDMVESLDAGAEWPRLRSLLRAGSAKEIVQGILFPESAQDLETGGTWLEEWRSFAQRLLGLECNTRNRSLAAIQEELWRHLLFSEFVLDLQETLPEALLQVPRAKKDHGYLVYASCDSIRQNVKCRDMYCRKADQIERELNLPGVCGQIEALGQRDTFRFEDRFFRSQVRKALMELRIEEATALLEERRQSVWLQEGDIGVQWEFLQVSRELVYRLDTAQAIPTGMQALLGLYQESGWQIDRAHRVWEQSLQKLPDREAEHELESALRKRYRAWAEVQQKAFMVAIEKEGWPRSGMLRQDAWFDSVVAQSLERRTRVAMVWVDAWRLEMAADFMEQQQARFSMSLQPLAGMLPSITPVGMASLLPGALGKIELKEQEKGLQVLLEGQSVSNAAERTDFLRKRFGDRFLQLGLDDLLRQGTPKVANTVDLLLVTTTEIDTAGENDTPNAFEVMSGTQRRFLQALNKLSTLGFHTACLVTDHGFLLTGEQSTGDRVEKPAGTWWLDKARALMGGGGHGGNSLLVSPEHVGVRTSAQQISFPRTLGTYRLGMSFVHSGLSLQESLLPSLTVQLAKPQAAPRAKLLLNRPSKTCTTRMVSIKLECQPEKAADDLFESQEMASIDLVIEARSGVQVVGRPATSTKVDAQTGIVRIVTDEKFQIILQMDENFQGEFQVLALDASTNMTLAKLENLRTAYVD